LHKALVADLKKSFDYVVIDTPPVGPVVDSVIVAALADKAIFVVRWASTSRELVQTAIQKVSLQMRVGGIVLARMPMAVAGTQSIIPNESLGKTLGLSGRNGLAATHRCQWLRPTLQPMRTSSMSMRTKGCAKKLIIQPQAGIQLASARPQGALGLSRSWCG
jgi:hypothetical protein